MDLPIVISQPGFENTVFLNIIKRLDYASLKSMTNVCQSWKQCLSRLRGSKAVLKILKAKRKRLIWRLRFEKTLLHKEVKAIIEKIEDCNDEALSEQLLDFLMNFDPEKSDLDFNAIASGDPFKHGYFEEPMIKFLYCDLARLKFFWPFLPAISKTQLPPGFSTGWQFFDDGCGEVLDVFTAEDLDDDEKVKQIIQEMHKLSDYRKQFVAGKPRKRGHGANGLFSDKQCQVCSVGYQDLKNLANHTHHFVRNVQGQ